MSKKWFSIEAKGKGSDKSADIYLFDYIGSWEISARRFIEQLKELDVGQINLHINSPGGEVFDGIAIQNSLKHHKATITVFIDGLAASIASIIALAGDEVHIADNAYVMIHNPTAIIYGEAEDMLKEAELLIKISNGLAGDYARKMGITVEAARSLMDDETWYLGQEAVDAGFADVVFEGTRAAAAFDVKRVATKAPKEVLQRFSKPDEDKNKTREGVMKKTKANNDQAVKDQEQTQDTVDTDEIETKEDVQEEIQAEDIPAADMDAKIKAALIQDRKRQTQIRALGKKFGFEAAAEEYADGDFSIEDFRSHILDQSPDEWRKSLEIKNPANQATGDDIDDAEDGAAVVAKIKERRKARFAG